MQHKLLEGTHRVTRPEAVELLRELVEVESPTGDAEGIAAMGRRMARELELLGGEIRFLDGGHVRADFAGAGDPLLVLGHLDTVWERGTLTRLPFRLEDGRAYGPGQLRHEGRPRRHPRGDPRGGRAAAGPARLPHRGRGAGVSHGQAARGGRLGFG